MVRTSQSRVRCIIIIIISSSSSSSSSNPFFPPILRTLFKQKLNCIITPHLGLLKLLVDVESVGQVDHRMCVLHHCSGQPTALAHCVELLNLCLNLHVALCMSAEHVYA